MLKGGAELGRGGQGRVNTMDDLVEAVSGRTTVRIVAVDLDSGITLRPEVPVSEVSQWRSAAVFKRPLPGFFAPTDVSTEFAGNLAIGRALADAVKAGTVTSDDVRILDEHTSFLLVDDRRLFIVGVEADAIPLDMSGSVRGGAGARSSAVDSWPWNDFVAPSSPMVGSRYGSKYGTTGPIAFPIYRRLTGDIYDLQRRFVRSENGLSADHLLQAAETVLRLVQVLNKLKVHHGDIKEENVMWTVAPGCRAAAIEGGAKACRFTFALTDFGMGPHVTATPRLKPSGTGGYICPLLYPENDEGRTKFIEATEDLRIPLDKHVQPGLVPTPSAIWTSYAGQRPNLERSNLDPKARERAEHAALTKNDLYALGVFLAMAENAPATVSAFAAALLTGSGKDSLWNAKIALETLEATRKRAEAAGELDVQVEFRHAKRASRPEGLGGPESVRVSEEKRRVPRVIPKGAAPP